MLKVAVLVSGGGTNLQALIDALRDGKIRDSEIVRVISSKADAYALKRAEAAGIETAVVSRKDHKDDREYGEALLKALDDSGAELIVLAGFLTILPETIVRKYENRIINIHPSLIPSFSGPGYYGLRVHEEAIRRGVKVSGATVHFVDEGCDSGPIILQKAVYLKKDDTPEILQKRIMEEAEWQLLPKAVDLIATGKVSIKEGIVEIDE